MSVMVSVVIPVYNIEQHLRQCLDSVAAQTLKDIEVICVDDGSTDGSANILEEYAKKDARFQIIRQKNAGPGAARNRGMEQAAGKYLIFLDSDDWFEPDFLQCMVEDAEQTGANVTICRADEFDTNTGKVYDGTWMLKTQFLPGKVFAPEDVAQHVFQFTYGWPWDKLYRRTYIEEQAFRYPDLAVSQDLVFVFPSVFCAKRIGVLDSVLIHHRINRQASVSHARAHHPDDSYQAAVMVRKRLEERCLWTQYSQSYLNWAMDFLVWHVGHISDRMVQRDCYRKMRTQWFREMRFDDSLKKNYRDRKAYIKYRLAKYAPYPFFVVVLKANQAWKDKRTGSVSLFCQEKGV